ncbi:probable E3 ubiquitin-protein ligase RHY1A [Populus nigra]|uniref:probable E3 ubiquitin-protein ligase RHY1A n=1 Tax=Populus nigra TaxID=3691 RepID=UPI002B2653EB|nr:probable E3 ubiquitin-protein ligase RHY1A [Populus nigra]
MTSASELFYQRRSRVSRANTDLGLEPSVSDRIFYQNYNRRHHNNHNHRHDLDGCDPLRRSPHVRHPCQRLSFLSERASSRLDQGTSQFVPSNNNSTETLSSTSRPRVTVNDRLPGAVVLARARLLERLRGVSLSGNRQSGRASLGIYNREYTLGDELRVVDAGDWGTDISTGLFAGGSLSDDSTLQTERLHTVQESHKKKPPGLTQDALHCLQSEVFSSVEKGLEGGVSQVSWDCSICLESFTEGDELIRLPCEHRFHSACLDPWVRTCGDCPYCRRDVVVTND